MKKVYVFLVILLAFLFFYSKTPSVNASKPSDFGLKEGDLISAIFSDDPDVYIINDQGYKRLFLNPEIFKFYSHLGGFINVKLVTKEVVDAFSTSGLFRDCESNDKKVYGVDISGEDTGKLHWVNTTGDQAVKDDPNFFKKVFCINNKEFGWYPKGNEFETVKDIPNYERTGASTTTASTEAVTASSSLKEIGKVVICHRPSGNPSETNTITIDASALKAHLATGDTVGQCSGTNPTSTPISTSNVCRNFHYGGDDFSNMQDNAFLNLLKDKGVRITGTPSGSAWSTRLSGTAGNTGEVIGYVSPNNLEADQGLSDDETIIIELTNEFAQAVELGFTVSPSTTSNSNPNIYATVGIATFDQVGGFIASQDYTLTGITNGKLTPAVITVKAPKSEISKIKIKALKYPSGGIWLKSVGATNACTTVSVPTPIPTIPAKIGSASFSPLPSTTPGTIPLIPITSSTASASHTPTPVPTPVPTPIAHSCGTPINVPDDTSSIQSAVDSACSGDTIYIKAGTYYGRVRISKPDLTINGASGTTANQVILDGGGKGPVIQFSINNPRSLFIRGLTLRNAILDNASPYVVYLDPTYSSGVGLYLNSIYDNFNVTVSDMIIRDNVRGIQIDMGKSGTVSISKNLIINNKGGYDGIVGDGGSGIHSDNYGNSQVLITNNTIANNGDGYTDWAGGGSRTFQNNIIVNNSNYGIHSNPYSTKTILYNDAWNNTLGNYYNGVTGLYGGGQVSFTPSPGTGDLSIDPQFVSSTDYHLKSTSPASGMGVYPTPISTSTPTPTPNPTPTPTGVISAPTSVIASLGTSSTGKINVTWSGGTGASKYEVYRCVVDYGCGGTSGYGFQWDPSDTYYYDYKVTSGSTYSYKVTACDSNGMNCSGGTISNSITYPAPSPTPTPTPTPTSDTVPPSTPTGLSATATSPSQINISWNASSDDVGVTSYKVYRNGTLVSSVGTTSYSDTGLSPITSYSYTVIAYDAAGNSSLITINSTKSATTLSGPTPTPATSSVSFDNFSRNLANVSKITRDLYVGSTGDDVKILQALLVNQVNYSADFITGYFGRITRDAVKSLQDKYGIRPAIGYFGEITRRALSALISN